MGMPVSRFSTFYKNGMHHDELNNFNLKVIVLHNPDDANTLRMLKDNFNELSLQTGNKLLFVTFFSPANRGGNNPYSFSKEQMSCDVDFSSDQMYQLCQILALEHVPLPMLLLTDDVDSDKILAIQLNGNDIPEVLLKLSKQNQDIVSNIDLTKSVLSAFNPNIFAKNLDLPLSDILTSFFASEAVSECGYNSLLQNSLYKWSEENERNLKEKIKSEKKKEHPDKERYDRFLIKQIEDHAIRELIDRGRTYGSRSRYRDTRIDIDVYLLDGIEKESTYAYNTAKRLISWMSDSYDNDYSGIALYLSKIIEIELNTSIVQEMRELLGIEMPEYYCKYKDGTQSYVITGNNKEYNLNACKDGVWKRLELGTFLGAYSQMVKMQETFTFTPLEFEFKEVLYNFYSRRNDFVHYDVMRYGEFQEQCNDFKTLMQFLPELMKRKRAAKYLRPI